LLVCAQALAAVPPQAKIVNTQGVSQAEAAAQIASKIEPRASRHALIIGVGDYLNPSIPQLKGVGYDIESALKMVRAMQVPLENTRILRDHEATAARIEQEISELNSRTQVGDRVFFIFRSWFALA